MAITLRLNFRLKGKITACMKKLCKISPVEFEWEKTGVDPRDILTKPEFQDVVEQVTITFANEIDANQFMSSPECVGIFQAANSLS